jgi:MSHA biogenesis protein MshJ
MKAQWKTWSDRFAAMNRREKYLVSGAVIALIVLGGYSLVIDPALVRKAAAEKQITQYRDDITATGAQVAALQAQVKNPDAAMHTELKETRDRLAHLGETIKGYDQQLIAPDQMTLVLQALLSGHRGLQLVNMRTLAPMSILASPADSAAKPGDAAKADAADAGGIYKHGIEITVAGSYQDLVAYVNEIEHSSQHLLLGRMKLSVARHPRVELTLTVYSLSLDRTWLVV